MKRDMDLVRQILFHAEAQAPGSRTPSMNIDGYDEVTVAKHIELLEDAGLVEANLLRAEGHGALKGQVERLTWAGHEFLDAARSDSVWQKAKNEISSKGLSVPLDVFKQLLVKLSAAALGL